ncbi:MAG: response regulator transcription factor [Rhodobacteraceae bacterium]|nr:response regulator transcription factor [Paracoccaceae bacterium]
MKLMVVEDDAETRDYLARGLGEAGFAVTAFAEPRAAMLDLAAHSYDAIVLDRMMPGMDGIDVLKLMRGAQITTPVIMLTARSAIDDRVAGLEAGADDYLVKPFALSELVARLKTIARRPAMAEPEADLTLGDIRLDRLKREATRAGELLDLSPLEFKLLEFMLQNPGTVVTKTMLLEKVWGYRFDPKTSLVQTHMSRLRAKVDKPFEHEMIRTVRGSGYVIDAP